MASTPQSNREKKAHVQAYFSRTAQSYVTSNSHRTGSDLQSLLALGDWNTQQQALDIATGGGHTALAIAPYVAQVTVTDLTPAMLEQARTFLLSQGVSNTRFQLADAEALPFADASFDCVTCRIAPHHFPNVEKFVQEVARVLKPQGFFLLIDNIAPADPLLDAFDNTIEKWRDNSHGRSYTRAEWQTFCERAGMQIEHIETFSKPLNYDDWTARSQMPAQAKAELESYILNSAEPIRHYFAVNVREDGHLANFSIDYILLKSRKGRLSS